MAIIIVANQKGGVGKSTTSANLLALLAAAGGRILGVDLDAQGHFGKMIGTRMPLEGGARSVLHKGVPISDAVVRAGTVDADLVPAVPDLNELDVLLALEAGGQVALREALRAVSDAYEHVVIDCPPNLGLLTINGLVAADVIVVPIEATDSGAADGLAKLQVSNQKASVLRDVPAAPMVHLYTSYDPRLNAVADMEATMEAASIPIAAKVPNAIAVAEACSAGTPYVLLKPDSVVAGSYRSLVSATLEAVAS